MNFPTLAWRDEILYFTHYFAIVSSETFLFFFSCGWIKHCWNTYASAYVRHQKNRKLWICANGKVLSEKIWLNHRYPSHWTIDGHKGKRYHWIGLQSMISGMQAEKYVRVSATALCSRRYTLALTLWFVAKEAITRLQKGRPSHRHNLPPCC